MGLIGGVDVLGPLQRCTVSVLDPPLQHRIGLVGFGGCCFPVIGIFVGGVVGGVIDGRFVCDGCDALV